MISIFCRFWKYVKGRVWGYFFGNSGFWFRKEGGGQGMDLNTFDTGASSLGLSGADVCDISSYVQIHVLEHLTPNYPKFHCQSTCPLNSLFTMEIFGFWDDLLEGARTFASCPHILGHSIKENSRQSIQILVQFHQVERHVITQLERALAPITFPWPAHLEYLQSLDRFQRF